MGKRVCCRAVEWVVGGGEVNNAVSVRERGQGERRRGMMYSIWIP